MDTPKPEFKAEYFGPRYWSTWLLIGFMRLIAALPYPVQQALGTALGKLLYKLGGKRKSIAEDNIRACFPDLDEQQQAQLVRETFVANAKGYVECCIAWWCPIKPFADKMIVEGLDLVNEARAKGKGILLFGGHFSILDFALPLIAAATPVGYMYRPSDNPLMDTIIERSRRKFCTGAFTKFQMKEMIRYIKQNKMVWYAMDQDMGAKNSIFAPFFGVPAATLATLGWLARSSGAQPMFLSQFRDGDGVYRICFRNVPDFPTNDNVENATILNRVLEEEIRRYPAQYLWLHRRFKTRPEGEERFYTR